MQAVLTCDCIRDVYTLQSIYVFSFVIIHVTWICDLNTLIRSLLLLVISSHTSSLALEAREVTDTIKFPSLKLILRPLSSFSQSHS